MNEIIKEKIYEFLDKHGEIEIPSKVVKKLADTFVLSEDEALKLYKEWRNKFINKA